MKLFSALTYLFIVLMTLIACKQNTKSEAIEEKTKVNLSHLDKLYEEVTVNNQKVGIVHIYSEAPEYNWVGDEDEGIACVDDAARAAIVYARHFQQTGEKPSLEKAKMLTRFVLGMQSEEGYFNNFIWPDYTIHTEGETTKAIPSWWSWRALWMMGEVLNVLETSDELTPAIIASRDKLVNKVLQETWWRKTQLDTAGGFDIPTWLPGTGASADQAGILLSGLTLQHQQASKGQTQIAPDSLKTLMLKMADGIKKMQVKDPNQRHDGVMLSWNNLWHAYGNIQSYALLMAGKELSDTSMTNAALYEVDHFVSMYAIQGPFNHFYLKKTDKRITEHDLKVFPQIAYGLRPVVWSTLKAAEVTGDEKYKKLAHDLSLWMLGTNPTMKSVYEEGTGRGFDGINSTNEVNMNSGAESTIECLLILLELEKANAN